MMLSPAILVLLVITVFPFFYLVGVSFSGLELAKPYLGSPFVGFANYIDLLTNERFWNSVKLTAIFTACALTIEFLAGFGLALMLKDKFPGKNLVLPLFLIPMVIPPVVVGLSWRFLFDATIGFVNYIIGFLGISGKSWLADPSLALITIIVADIWQWTPFMMLVLLAGFQSLPIEPFEASKVDGATGFQTFRYITLPLMQGAIMVAILIRSIDIFRAFDVIYMMTEGGPGTATETMSIYSYLMGFSYFRTGAASAFAVIMLAITIFVCQIFLKFMRREEVT